MTAENEIGRIQRSDIDWASMRPRPMTAENARSLTASSSVASSFNEAAADDRGKLRRRASRRRTCPRWCFNEAAADDRGKRTPPR